MNGVHSKCRACASLRQPLLAGWGADTEGAAT
jgi:hypothetical protein